MSKTKELAAAFIQKSQNSLAAPAPRGLINAFNSLFSVQELTDVESLAIDRIMVGGCEPGTNIEKDVFEIKRLTKELKAIRRQEIVLIGERIAQAREIFKNYKERSFREWMEFTFNAFKTGYNYLAFYDLYLSVPEHIQSHLKEMPAKAVYVLASKKAPVEQKIELVEKHSKNTAQNLISLIQETFGDDRIVVRKPSNDKVLSVMEKNAAILLPERLDATHRKRLIALIEHLQDLVDHAKKLS
ncbi:MAG: CT583 family protein [Verrucomicrobia bacterium]|nr:CT583 family protein [Verrucomicrobiota bacterium]